MKTRRSVCMSSVAFDDNVPIGPNPSHLHFIFRVLRQLSRHVLTQRNQARVGVKLKSAEASCWAGIGSPTCIRGSVGLEPSGSL